MSEPPLSEAARLLLRDLPARFPAERIDRLWLFAPREVSGRESGLVVLSLLPPPGEPPAQRLLVTVRYRAERTPRGQLHLADEVQEQGWAPAERLPRVIEGVLRRLRDETEAEPVSEAVRGSPARWAELLARLGVPPVDPSGRE